MREQCIKVIFETINGNAIDKAEFVVGIDTSGSRLLEIFKAGMLFLTFPNSAIESTIIDYAEELKDINV